MVVTFFFLFFFFSARWIRGYEGEEESRTVWASCLPLLLLLVWLGIGGGGVEVQGDDGRKVTGAEWGS